MTSASTEGQRGARRAQRWLSAVMVLSLVGMWYRETGPAFDRMSASFIICWAAVLVIDAMRALMKDRP